MPAPTPPARIEATIEIKCSPKEVWQTLGDFEHVDVWAPGISDSIRTTGAEIGVGSRRTVRYRRLFTMEQVVNEWIHGKSLTYNVFKAPWPLRHFEETWTVTPSVSGSRVHTEVRYDLWFGAVGRFADWLFTRHVLLLEMRSGQRGLKRAVERGQA
jgi:uncharacterized protein YndB with AHSA1/START domain